MGFLLRISGLIDDRLETTIQLNLLLFITVIEGHLDHVQVKSSFLLQFVCKYFRKSVTSRGVIAKIGISYSRTDNRKER